MAEETVNSENNKTKPETCDRVGVKLPTFWTHKPAMWFAMLEGQFYLTNITADSTKFYYVLSKLDDTIASEVEDIILNPPPTNKYDKLKKELIARLSATQEQKVRQLLSHEEMGDRKPSQFFRHLQNLAGESVPEEFLRSLWASRLPTHIQAIIAVQSGSNMEAVAAIADKVNEITPEPVAQIASASTSKISHDAAAAINMRIDKLVAQVAALTTNKTRLHSSKMSTRRRSRSGSRSRASSGWCWYHSRFRERSTRCRAPCTYRDEGNASSNH